MSGLIHGLSQARYVVAHNLAMKEMRDGMMRHDLVEISIKHGAAAAREQIHSERSENPPDEDKAFLRGVEHGYKMGLREMARRQA